MSIKKTIAIVGATGKLGRAIVSRFASTPYRLLIVSNKPEELKQFTSELKKQKTVAEIEPLECVKDSCWEADIILLSVAPSEEKRVAELMKDVTTQKIVAIVSEIKNECNELKKALPYSKIVTVSFNCETDEVLLVGECETVNEEILFIFKQAGYRTVSNTKISNY